MNIMENRKQYNYLSTGLVYSCEHCSSRIKVPYSENSL